MDRGFRRILHRLLQAAPDREISRLIIGSTGSGKSEGELADLVRIADRGNHAVVLLDGHGPLAFKAAGHWAAHGHESRLVYEPLAATDRVLCWDMLPQSAASDPSRRLLEDAETREELAQCFMNQRGIATLNDRGFTKEWLDASLSLCLAQPHVEPLHSLLAAFRVGTQEYDRLLRGCRNAEVVAKFADLERVKRRNPVQYEVFTGATRRLLELTCASEVVRLRSRPGPFQWLDTLRQRSLIALDGGGIRTRELKSTLFLLVSLQVIHAVRRHFAETQQPLPVVLVLEEAGAMGLVTPFVLLALQELRKAGLAFHIISQSSLDFGDPSVIQSLLGNTPWQAWYQSLSPADQELGAKVLCNAAFDPLAVHFTRIRQVRDGVEAVVTESRGEATDPHGEVARRDTRSGMALVSRYREETEDHFQSPILQEQQYRTRLATLRIGERIVRDRHGIRAERVRLLRPPRPRREFGERTQAAIERIRRQPIYLAPEIRTRAPLGATPPDAAERLRAQVS